jgi:hypothetical protein
VKLEVQFGHSRSIPSDGNSGFAGKYMSANVSLIWEKVNAFPQLLQFTFHFAISALPAGWSLSDFTNRWNT